jgi:hypothetical protein
MGITRFLTVFCTILEDYASEGKLELRVGILDF